MESIFKRNMYGHICYTRDVTGRLSTVKRCEDIEALKDALDTPGLQKTVEKAINLKIKRLEK